MYHYDDAFTHAHIMHTQYTHIHRVLDRRWDFIIGPGLCLSFLAKTAPERLTEGENFMGKVGQAAAHLKQATVVCKSYENRCGS